VLSESYDILWLREITIDGKKVDWSACNSLKRGLYGAGPFPEYALLSHPHYSRLIVGRSILLDNHC